LRDPFDVGEGLGGRLKRPGVTLDIRQPLSDIEQ
jgi:hypothetical protein